MTVTNQVGIAVKVVRVVNKRPSLFVETSADARIRILKQQRLG